MKKLRYGNTNTFFIKGGRGGLLIDTDYAGTLPQFFGAIKAAGIRMEDITHVIATHYHPDHMGIIGELQKLGVVPVLADVQKGSVHFSDGIFAREGRRDYVPVDENAATVINCEESRAFLEETLGIGGEIISTPSHSADSISIILDDGSCFVGDLEPREYLAAYGQSGADDCRAADEHGSALGKDWDRIMSFSPKHIYYAHANDKEI